MKNDLVGEAKSILEGELNDLKKRIKGELGSCVSAHLTKENPHPNTLLSLILELEMVENENEENGLALSISVLTYDPFQETYTPLNDKLFLLCDLSTSVGAPLSNVEMKQIELQDEQSFNQWINTVRVFIETNHLYITETLRDKFS